MSEKFSLLKRETAHVPITCVLKKNEIMDKINSFFGYNCISNVTLKIVSNKM